VQGGGSGGGPRERKRRLRLLALRRRRSIPKEELAALSARVEANLVSTPEYRDASTTRSRPGTS